MFDVEHACRDLPIRHYRSGDRIIEEGEAFRELLFLVKGSVQVRRGGIAVANCGVKGMILGEIAFLLARPHLAEVRALTDSSFYVVGNPQDFVQEHPECVRHLAELLARKVDLVSRYLVDLKRQYGDAGDDVELVQEVVDSLLRMEEGEI